MSRFPLLLAVALAACGPVTFPTTLTGESVIPGSRLGGILNVFPALSGFSSLNFDDNQDFKNQQVARDHVTSVKVESFQLKVVSPSSQDFGFLDSVEFYARTGETELLFAQKQNIASLGLAAPNPVLGLDLPTADLAPFVAAPSMSIVMRGRGRQPSQDTRLSATVKLVVQAKVF